MCVAAWLNYLVPKHVWQRPGLKARSVMARPLKVSSAAPLYVLKIRITALGPLSGSGVLRIQ